MQKIRCKNCKNYYKNPKYQDVEPAELKYCFSCRSLNSVLISLACVFAQNDNYGKKSVDIFVKKIDSILLK